MFSIAEIACQRNSDKNPLGDTNPQLVKGSKGQVATLAVDGAMVWKAVSKTARKAARNTMRYHRRVLATSQVRAGACDIEGD